MEQLRDEVLGSSAKNAFGVSRNLLEALPDCLEFDSLVGSFYGY